jgi:hypothetical protein
MFQITSNIVRAKGYTISFVLFVETNGHIKKRKIVIEMNRNLKQVDMATCTNDRLEGMEKNINYAKDDSLEIFRK